MVSNYISTACTASPCTLHRRMLRKLSHKKRTLTSFYQRSRSKISLYNKTYIFVSSFPQCQSTEKKTKTKNYQKYNQNRSHKTEHSFTDGNELAEAAAHSLVVTVKKSIRTNDGSRFSHPYPLIVTGATNGTATATIATNRYSKSQSLSPPLQQKLQNYPSSYDETNLLSRSRSSSLSCSKPITANGVHHALQTGEDSSQSSLNLSASSGYLSGSSANSSVGGSNLNLSLGGANNNSSGIAGTSIANGNGTILNGVHLNAAHNMQQGSQQQQLPTLPNMAATIGRRRTISSNSNG